MGKDKYRIGAIGFAHSHMMDNLKAFETRGGRFEFVAAADVPPRVPSELTCAGSRNGDLLRAVERYHMKRYDDPLRLIEESELDVALVCAENAWHPAVAEALLRRGVHVVVEKPLAADLPGALRIARAARESRAKVIVNWPSTWLASMRYAQRLCAEGAVGKALRLNYRNGDSLGPLSYGQNATDEQKGREWWHQTGPGGGALLDYCCYGALLSCWFLGPPVSAYGCKANLNSPYASAEDYATITVRFSESLALLEGSWATVNSGVAAGPIVFGAEGTLVVQPGGRVDIFRTRHKPEPDESLFPPTLPQGRENLAGEVLHHLDTGEPPHPTLDLPLNLQAMAVLDAGSRSAASGKMEPADGGTWRIGDDVAMPPML